MLVGSYIFTFPTEGAARIFVERVAHYAIGVATLRNGTDVHVLDSCEETDQREVIFRLARGSEARSVKH